MRALRMRSSASSFDRNDGYTCSTPGTTSAAWRAPRPSGPSTRTTSSVRREPAAAGGADRRSRPAACRPGGTGRPPGGCRPAATAPARRPAPPAPPGAGGCAPSRRSRPWRPRVTARGQRALDRQRAGAGASSASSERHEQQAPLTTTSSTSTPATGQRRAAPPTPARRRPPDRRVGTSPRRRTARGPAVAIVSGAPGVAARTPSSTPSTVAPSSSSSGRSWMRCRRHGLTTALTSSGVTNGRPASQAHALAACRTIAAPRGDTPSVTDGAVRVARARATM